jgi:hypothetical protein
MIPREEKDERVAGMLVALLVASQSQVFSLSRKELSMVGFLHSDVHLAFMRAAALRVAHLRLAGLLVASVQSRTDASRTKGNRS